MALGAGAGWPLSAWRDAIHCARVAQTQSQATKTNTLKSKGLRIVATRAASGHNLGYALSHERCGGLEHLAFLGRFGGHWGVLAALVGMANAAGARVTVV